MEIHLVKSTDKINRHGGENVTSEQKDHSDAILYIKLRILFLERKMQQINSINQVDIQYQMITFATLSIFIYLFTC